MKTKRNCNALFIICLLSGLVSMAQTRQRYIYASLSNTKDIDTKTENYISAIDAGVVFGIGEYIYGGGGVTMTKVWGAGYSSLAAGIGPDLHIHLIRKEKFRFILEGKGRVMGFFPEYPEDALNYAFWGGPVIEFSVSQKHRLKLGLCYNHLSNARPIEQVHNKSLDGLGVNIGWAFY